MADKKSPKKPAAKKPVSKTPKKSSGFIKSKPGKDGPPVIDEALSGPTLFVDGIQGMAFTKSLVKLNFVQDVSLSGGPLADFPEDHVFRKVCLRMFMEKEVFLKITDYFVNVSKAMREEIEAEAKKEDASKE